MPKRNTVVPQTHMHEVEQYCCHGDEALWQSIRSNGIPSRLRPFLWPVLLTLQEGHAVELESLLGIAAEHERAASLYAEKGGSEPWAQTACRIGMDADRISDEPDILRGAARPEGVTRLRRILTAYALHDCKVGYCQGMADLCIVPMQLYEDDKKAFAAFHGLMTRVRANFLSGMLDMQRQLWQLGWALDRVDRRLHRHLVRIGAGSYVFAFQMLLLQLRREVAWPDVFTLWECMWASEALLSRAQQRQQQKQDRQSRRFRWRNRRRSGGGACFGHGAVEIQSANTQQDAGRSGDASPSCQGIAGVRAAAERQAVVHGGDCGPAMAVAGDAMQEGAAGPSASKLDAGANAAGDCDRAVVAAASSEPLADLRVYVVAAALRRERRALLACQGLEDVVQLVNHFPRPRDVIGLVCDAERIYRTCHGGVTFRHSRSMGHTTGRPLRFLSGCLRPKPSPTPTMSSAVEHSPSPAGPSGPPAVAAVVSGGG